MPRNKKGFHFVGATIPVKDAQRLAVAAKKQKRSVANLIEVILGDWLSEHDSNRATQAPSPESSTQAEVKK
jgi:hypothetical protein